MNRIEQNKKKDVIWLISFYAIIFYMVWSHVTLIDDYNELLGKAQYFKGMASAMDLEKSEIYDDAQNRCESYKLYDVKLVESEFGIGGLYWDNEYYCVWTKDKTEEEINATECHEACHHLVNMYPEHFCYKQMGLNADDE